MRISTLQLYTRSLNALLDNQTVISKIQNQMSTGKKINSSSDDPVGLSQAFYLNQTLDTTTQYQNNNQTAQGRLQFEESALNHAQDVIQKIYVLAVSANKSSLDAPNKAAIAAEIDTRLNELVQLANDRLPTGEYLFGGFKSLTQPVLALSPSGFSYAGDDGQINLQIGSSVQIPVNDPGNSVFFDIPAAQYNPSVTTGLAVLNGNATVFPATAGSVAILNSGDLILNQYAVQGAVASSDTVSTTDHAASAIAVAAAINAGTVNHHVSAVPESNILNLGVYTPGSALSGSQLKINGQAIDTAGDTTEAGLLAAINALSATTGVSAQDSAGNILLTATDGRNIQVQTDGTSATSKFANFNLNGGSALNQVQAGGVQLRSPSAITLAGANPVYAGFTSGTTAVSFVPAGLSVSQIKTVLNPSDTIGSFSLVFNNPPTTFSVVSNQTPGTFYTGPDPNSDELGATLTYDGTSTQSTYTSGMTIQINGVQYVLKGNAAAGDTLTLGLAPQGYQDLFSSIQNLSTGIKASLTAGELDYNIGIAIQNLKSATDVISSIQAELGARQNVLSSEYNLNEDFNLSTTQSLVQIQYLDNAGYEEAISNFQLYTLTLEMAQKTFVTMQYLSLFNYM